jgi:hypothetical protein
MMKVKEFHEKQFSVATLWNRHLGGAHVGTLVKSYFGIQNDFRISVHVAISVIIDFGVHDI